MNIETDLREVLTARAKRCVRLADGHLNTGEFFLGGSAIATREMSDIDVYPAGDAAFTIPTAAVVLAATKNATTISGEPPLQFCKFQHATLRDLIESFDFAHVQAGAHINDGKVIEVAWTGAFVAANACRTSAFVGSAYPLSSAVRLLKYQQRGELTRHSATRAILTIVHAIVKRGFADYDDFKDQLDAVDLGMTIEQVGNVTVAPLMELFEMLRKDGAQ